jgi:hypothetical protein
MSLICIGKLPSASDRAIWHGWPADGNRRAPAPRPPTVAILDLPGQPGLQLDEYAAMSLRAWNQPLSVALHFSQMYSAKAENVFFFQIIGHRCNFDFKSAWRSNKSHPPPLADYAASTVEDRPDPWP